MEVCELGQRILFLLKERNMTQKQLAQYMDINEATLSRYISGERVPRSDNIATMATVLCTTTDYILGVENEPDFCINRIVNLIKYNLPKITSKDKKEIITALFDDDLNK